MAEGESAQGGAPAASPSPRRTCPGYAIREIVRLKQVQEPGISDTLGPWNRRKKSPGSPSC